MIGSSNRDENRWADTGPQNTGSDPRQYGLDFGLWTHKVVVELVGKKFSMTLGLTAVSELLAKLGLASQKPLQRAYQRDPGGHKAIKEACAEKSSPRKWRGHAVTEMLVGRPLSLYRSRKQTTLRS